MTIATSQKTKDVDLPPFAMAKGRLKTLKACKTTRNKQEIIDISGFCNIHVRKNVLPEMVEHELLEETNEGYKTTDKGKELLEYVMQFRDYNLDLEEQQEDKEYQDIVG